MNTFVYKIGNNCYINLTNSCSNSCDFCVRNGKESFCDYELWLSREPSAEEVIGLLTDDFQGCKEYVFCGFGEPLYAIDRIVEIGSFLKRSGKRVRLNTNGQADLIVGGGVAERLKGAVDTVSISLNATTAERYQEICSCEFGEEGFYSLKRFAVECKNAGLEVVLSVVDCIGEDELAGAAVIADELGVRLRIRAKI